MTENIALKIWKSLRMSEAFLVSGFIFSGGLFGIYHSGCCRYQEFLLFIFASYSLMLAIYALNSFLGFHHDKSNPRLFNLNGFSKTYYMICTLVFYIISFLTTLLLHNRYFFLHPIIFALWFFYSVPGYGKHLPVVGTVIHFFVAIIQFVFAYSFFNSFSFSVIMLSCYPALLFSAGHLHHEIIDYEADAGNKINSSTVKWGIKKIKFFSFGIFIIAYLFLSLLFYLDIINLYIYIIFGFTTAFQILFFLIFCSKFESNRKSRLYYRLSYRMLFLLSGISFTVYVLINRCMHVF